MPEIVIKRIYEKVGNDDGFRVLVDRIWPRGVSKATAAIDYWAKEVTPTTELRKWFGHDPDRWAEFRRRYRSELKQCDDELKGLLNKCDEERMTLLYAAKDQQHNHAIVLRDTLVKYDKR